MTDRIRRLALAGAFVLVFSIFWRGALEVPFQLDDEGLIEGNEQLRAPLSPFKTVVLMIQAPFGRQLATFSLHLDFLLWGLHPAGYHVTSLLLHLAAVGAVWLLVYRGYGALWPDPTGACARRAALISAVIFAFHPMQVESVVYLSARSTLLSTLCGLGGVLAVDEMIVRRRRGEPRWRRFLGLAGVGFFSSVGAMPLGLVFPAIAFVWAALIRKTAWRTVLAGGVLAVLPFLGLAGDLAHFFRTREGFRPPGYSTAYWLTQPECLLGAAGKILLPVSPTLDYDIMPVGVTYLPGPAVLPPKIREGKLVLPFKFSPGDTAPPAGVVFEEPSGAAQLSSPVRARSGTAPFRAAFAGVRQAVRDRRVWGPLLVLAAAAVGLSAWILRAQKDRPAASSALAVGAALFLLAWLPPAAAPLEDLFFEHHLYAPMIAVAWLSGVFLSRAWERAGGALRAAAGYSVVAALLFWGVAVSERVETWARKDAIWADAARKSPGKPRPRFNLATVWHKAHRPPPERLRRMCLNASIAYVPFRDNADLTAEIPNLLGGIQQRLGNLELAHFFYRDAVIRMPENRAFRVNMAANARALGRHEEAAGLYAALVRDAPRDPGYLLLYAEELAALGQLTEARDLLMGIVDRHPGLHAAVVDLAAVMIQQGDLGEAEMLCTWAVKSQRSAPLLYNMGVAFLSGARREEARRAFLSALSIDPAYGPAHEALRGMAAAPESRGAPEAPGKK